MVHPDRGTSLSTKNQMSHRAVKRQGGTLNAHDEGSQPAEAAQCVLPMTHLILKKAKLWGQ